MEIVTSKKVLMSYFWRIMANSPIPDQSEEFRKSGMVLITDPRSDYYLKRVPTIIESKKIVNYDEMIDKG